MQNVDLILRSRSLVSRASTVARRFQPHRRLEGQNCAKTGHLSVTLRAYISTKIAAEEYSDTHHESCRMQYKLRLRSPKPSSYPLRTNSANATQTIRRQTSAVHNQNLRQNLLNCNGATIQNDSGPSVHLDRGAKNKRNELEP